MWFAKLLFLIFGMRALWILEVLDNNKPVLLFLLWAGALTGAFCLGAWLF